MPNEDDDGGGFFGGLWDRFVGEADKSEPADEAPAGDDQSDDDSSWLADAFDSAGEFVRSAVEESGSDPDDDGLTNAQEAAAGTDPLDADTDDDGGDDGFELLVSHTDPLRADSGDDGPSFFESPIAAIADVLDDATGGVVSGLVDRIAEADPDEDGLTTADELRLGTDPFNDDTDGDMLEDGWEIEQGTDPVDWDTDDDGLSDFTEVMGGKYSPTKKDTDGDGITDGDDSKTARWPSSTEDSDLDGVPDDAQQMGRILNSDGGRRLIDRDGDGLTDVAEARLGTDPTNRDSDGDNIPDFVEVRLGTDPLVPESLRAESAPGLEAAIEDWDAETEVERDYLEGTAKIHDIVYERRLAVEKAGIDEDIDVPAVAEAAEPTLQPEVVVEEPTTLGEEPTDTFETIDASVDSLLLDGDEIGGE
jgi:hypothetical protein